MTVLLPNVDRSEGVLALGQPRSKALLRFHLAVALVLVDCLSVIAAFTSAELLRFGTMASGKSMLLLGAFLPIYLLSAAIVGAFAGPVLIRRSAAVSRSLGALIIAACLIGMVIFFLKAGPDISRVHFAAGLALSGVLLPLARSIYVKFAEHRLGDDLYSVVELRDDQSLASDERVPTFDTIGFFDPANPTPESLDRLARLIANADRVIVSCSEARRSAWAHALQGMNVHGEIVLPAFEDIRPLGIETYRGKTTMLVGRGPLNLGERFAKRLFDLALALGALAFFTPLMVMVAVAIKLDSPGPVIFKQLRIGRQNRLFHVRKFRSMRVAGSDGPGTRSTARDDDRITRVGRFIRGTSIDELPQIFNILLGDMSVVGPRPHAVGSTAEDRLFWEIDGRYWHRHACKPGLTGLAQVRGFRGSTASVKDITDRLASDLEYLAHWSLWRDIVIVLRTVKVILHENAY